MKQKQETSINNGYYTQPHIRENQVVLISDDDLWGVQLDQRIDGSLDFSKNYIARRLTNTEGIVSAPLISRCGEWIYYVSTDQGVHDVYKIPLKGGVPERLTYLGVSPLLDYGPNQNILFYSTHESHDRSLRFPYELDPQTKNYKKLNLGPAVSVGFEDSANGKGRRVLGINSMDSARWKRYRGGTAGKIWVEGKVGSGKFTQILKEIEYNLTGPAWFHGRIYFVSDHEGIANIYSVTPEGKKITRHTHFNDYYGRNLKNDGKNFVFHSGGRVYVWDGHHNVFMLNIETPSTSYKSLERFVSAQEHLFSVGFVSQKTQEVSLITRGKLFSMHPWIGSAIERELKSTFGFFKAFAYTHDGKKILASHQGTSGSESLIVFDGHKKDGTILFPKKEFGKVWSILASPVAHQFILANNRNELWHIDLDREKAEKIITENLSRLDDIAWSPGGRYLAYTSSLDQSLKGIKIYDFKTKKSKLLFEPISIDFSPSFDSTGKYLYFIGIRDLRTVYNESHFDLGFPLVSLPYVVTLNADTEVPHHAIYANEDEVKKVDQAKKSSPKKLKIPFERDIDFDGIEQRILPLQNAPRGGYAKLQAFKNKILYIRADLKVDHSPWSPPADARNLYSYSMETLKEELFHKSVLNFEVTASKNFITLTLSDQRVRVLSPDQLPKPTMEFHKNDGMIDLKRLNVKIHPKLEWAQIYHEAWLLQKEHFWDHNMSNIHWENVRALYEKLLPKIRTRKEFSDLLWEMQGELGTSHCYESGGDYYAKNPNNLPGKLGARLKYIDKDQSFLIEEIFSGDSWISGQSSPLCAPGVALVVGDKIKAFNQHSFKSMTELDQFLINFSGKEILLDVIRKGQSKVTQVNVKCLNQQMPLVYRQWVNKNKKYVHEKSKGKIGYVHIPDMGYVGYQEFYRHYLAESKYEGLIVDVRFNGGGHVSQHILKVLAQKVIGVDTTRWNGVSNYPNYGVNGPIVALTNEYAGSDGDIFSHSFKLLKIGKLVGKRTWGGVIGINGQYILNDFTRTTQPEYSFYFKDVGYAVENYGTDPDIEVDITPEDWKMQRDPQLDKSIEVALQEMKKNPPLKFAIDKKPNLGIQPKENVKNS